MTDHLHGLKLGPKLGPFPAAVWALIIAGGLYVAHRRQQQAAASAPATTATDTTATDTTATSTDVPYGVSSDTPAVYVPAGDAGGSAASSGAAVAITDNLTWQSAAIAALIKAGTLGTTANNAIVDYLAGVAVSAEEAHAINVALSLVGPPPEGAPPVTVKPAPTVRPPVTTPAAPRPITAPIAPRPAASHPAPAPSKSAPSSSHGARYTVRSGDTLYAIAAAHRGVSEPALYSKNAATIEAAARRHGKTSSEHGHWIYPGTILVLP